MHLYIHIPFCESKCFYCSFTSLKKKDFEKYYLNALMQ
ncbi:oxygen-independent coproporphyrinogen III oxidase, partial [Campylobacter lari]|nr:oxygen-independent coproporphyrinogen III oxidase [Campylobacter lari]